MEYAYLVASLPRLELTGAAPFTAAEWLLSCEGVVRRDHLGDLRAIVEDRPNDVRTPEARRLVDLETQLRNALALVRAQRAGAEHTVHPRRHAGFDVRVEEVAARAMTVEDPLERELLLDRHRWALLEEASSLPAFGVQAVFAYGSKLRLVEKWAAADDESGLAVAARIVERNLAGIGL